MLAPIAFEDFVAEHFSTQGYKVTSISISGDYGVDIFAEKKGYKIAIQAKMYGGSSRKINRKCVMELYGAKTYFDCDKAIIATNGEILKDALDVAKKLKIEILILEFNYESKPPSLNPKSFESIWNNFIIPLENKELFREDGSKNVLLKVDGGGITRLTSNGKVNKINIEIFKETYNLLIHQGSISRDYINQNYIGRASSGVILILSQLPFVEVRKNPLRLHLDETQYLLNSSKNENRLLKSITQYQKG